MSQSAEGQNAPTIPVSTPRKAGGKVPRRLLLSAAGVVACGAVCAVPVIAVEHGLVYTEEQLQAAVANAKQDVYKGLLELENVGLGTAIGAAEVTQVLVANIVVPVFKLFSVIGTGVLDVLLGIINTVEGPLNFVHINTSALDALKDMLNTWKTNINALPQAFSTYSNADFKSAETYLAALQSKVQEAQNATPASTKGPF
ncbi:MAG TPA: hypothetical protein VIG30_19495 [Ktedonobacterales bacterium]|jgi:hypothetical protein